MSMSVPLTMVAVTRTVIILMALITVHVAVDGGWILMDTLAMVSSVLVKESVSLSVTRF